jgi:hypothetical protein
MNLSRLEILVREVPKDRKIDPVFDEAVRMFGESERSKPLPIALRDPVHEVVYTSAQSSHRTAPMPRITGEV